MRAGVWAACVALAMTAAAAAGSGPVLEGTDWTLIRLDGKPIAQAHEDKRAHFALDAADHRISGSGGCNRFMGPYTLDGPRVSFGPLASTQMACETGMDREAALLAALEKVKAWRIAGRTLEMVGSDGAVLAAFDPSDAD